MISKGCNRSSDWLANKDRLKMVFPDETITAAKSPPVPSTMRAWILGGPGELKLGEKPVPTPKRGEVLVRIDAVAICATDLEIIDHGTPAMIQGGLPFNKNFTPGHEYMGTIAALGPSVDEYQVGERVTVEIHAGCAQCKRCEPTDSPPMAVLPNTRSTISIPSPPCRMT